MKKFVLTLATVLVVTSVFAQPRAIGGYLSVFGAEGIGASYQHSLANDKMFVEADAILSYDYGYTLGGWGSISVNYIFAQPEWLSFADMNAYAGIGIAGGWVGDALCTGNWYDYGGPSQIFGGGMIGPQFSLGIEANMKFGLSISMDIKPIFAAHFNRWMYDRSVGLYKDGLMMFCPGIGVRYRFH